MVSSGSKATILYLSFFLFLEAFAFVSNRPNFKANNDPIVLRSHHKGKRAWDLPYASDTQDEPVLAVVSENAVDKTEVSTVPENDDSMWLDIGRDFQETKDIKINTDGSLECEAVGSPPPKVFWLRNGLPIESMTIVTNEDTMKNRVEMGNNVAYDKFGNTGMANVKAKLPIKCAQPEDQGHYTCVAVNKGKQVSATTYLTVSESSSGKTLRGSCEYRSSMFSYKKAKKGSVATVVNHETFHMETIGKHIVLPCRSVGKPRPTLTWLDQEGKKIISGKKYQVSTSGSLVIRNLVWKDMGVYTCIVENAMGMDSITTFVYPLSDGDSEES